MPALSALNTLDGPLKEEQLHTRAGERIGNNEEVFPSNNRIEWV